LDFNRFEQTDGAISSVEQTVAANKSTRVLIPREFGADTFVHARFQFGKSDSWA
jgi:hypothetical protein